MLNQINEVLKNDGVIAYVTDTVWGLGCLPSSEKAVKRIYEIKHRDGKKPLILMSDEFYNLFEYLKQPIEKEAQKLIKKYFPEYRHERGSKIRANIYKYSALKNPTHLISFNKILDEDISFHKPKYFADFYLD